MLAVGALAALSASASGDWDSELVTLDPNARQLRMDVDSMGNVHVVFMSLEFARYGFKDASGWALENIESWVRTPSITVDANGQPHVCFYNSGYSILHYARRTGGEWVIEEAARSAAMQGNIDIAVDAAGWPHITYGSDDYAEGSLELTSKSAEGWATELVSESSVGWNKVLSRIELDSLGGIHVLFFDEHHNRYAYAYKDTVTPWQRTYFGSTLVVDHPGSIALDAGGAPHLVWFRWGYPSIPFNLYSPALLYSTPAGSSWVTEPIAETHVTSADVTVDDNGVVHVMYVADGVAMHATRQGGAWVSDPIDDEVAGVAAIGAAGQPHVGYRKVSGVYHAYPEGIDSTARFRINASGSLLADGTVYSAGLSIGSADLAEEVCVRGRIEPGDVIEHDPARVGCYRRSVGRCSPIIAGVISSYPGVILGEGMIEDDQALLALTGIVPVKVTDEGGPIMLGDLLISSSTPGHAMRWAGSDSCTCSLVGKALEPMNDETGIILVLLTAH